MNILILSHSDQGGAGAAARRVLLSFNKIGHNAKMIVRNKTTFDNNVVSILSSIERIVQRFNENINKIIYRGRKILGFKNTSTSNPKYYFFRSNENESYDLTLRVIEKTPFVPDIILVTFVGKFLKMKNLFDIYSYYKVPIVWYLMDMEPLTGGCHYAWSCDGYKNLCGNCPALYSNDEHDISFANLELKRKYVSMMNLTAVAGSEHLFKQCGASTLFRERESHKILLGIDPDIFRPIEKEKIRKKLMLPLDKKVIFFGATSLYEERKGGKYLLNALKNLAQTGDLEKRVFLLIAGNPGDFPFAELPFEYIHLGHLNSDRSLAEAYQAADVFLSPSIEDSGPMMINESIMCGTPVVSFDIGVAPDLVVNGVTGYRARLCDSDDLARGIASIIMVSDSHYKKMRAGCRSLALQKCNPDVQADQFIDIFNEVKKWKQTIH